MKNTSPKKPRNRRPLDEMKGEYDFPAGILGNYLDRYELGTNVILLEPEISQAFPDSKSANEALGALRGSQPGRKLASFTDKPGFE